MKMIVDIDDSILLRALTQSENQKRSLATFIAQALEAALGCPNPVSPRPPAKVEDLIAETLVRVNAIAAGKELFLPDVLTDTAWQTLTSGERKGFGKMFRKVVERDAQPIAKQVRRASNNLAVYLKV